MKPTPAIITPLSAAQYKERFLKDGTTALQIYLVQILDGKNSHQRSFVMLKAHSGIWVVQYCEPVQSERVLLAQQWYFETDPRQTKDPFETVLQLMIQRQPELIKWLN
jgi:hypothetical protein